MRSATLTAAVFILFYSNSAFGQPPPDIPSLSADQVERLERGEVLVEVVNQDIPRGDVLGVVQAPPDEVMEVLRDFGRHADLMDDVVSSEVLGTDGDHMLCKGLTDTPWPMDDREWVIRQWFGEVDLGGLRVLANTWDYVPDSGNINDTEGYWLLLPWREDNSQTLVRYVITVDLGTWLPDFLLSWSTENMLPGRIEALRDGVRPVPGS